MMKFSMKIKTFCFALFAVFLLCASVNTARADIKSVSGDQNYSRSTDLKNANIFVSDASYPSTTSDQGASKSGSSTSSSDASGDIFKILQKKIYNTLVDLRKIVYVISGFGLVAFAVAAIFNKISYKHLGYIMISLCLLALMFPFLEYFSGYSLESAQQKELTFKNFLGASDYSRIRGEIDADILNGKGEKPGEPGANDEATLAMKQANADAIKAAYTPQGIKVEEMGIEMPKTIQNALVTADEQEKAAFAKAGCNAASVSKEGGATTTKSAWDEKTGMRTVCVMGEDGKVKKTTEACQGKLNKNGVCKATGWQKVQSLTKTTQNAIAVTTAGVRSVGNTASMLSNVRSGSEAIWDIATTNGNDMAWYDKINNMSNVTTNTFGSNGKATRDAMDILKNYTEGNVALGNIGTEVNRNYENNPTGKNKFTDGRDDKNKQAEKKIGGTINNIGQGINQGASTGRDVHSQATNVNQTADQAKNAAKAWKNLFK